MRVGGMDDRATMAKDRDAGTANFAGPDWVSVRSVQWGRWLACFKGLPLVRGLEIGSFEGRSALWFMEHVLTDASASLLCVDPWSYSDEQRQLVGGTSLPARYDLEAAFKRFVENTAAYADAGRLKYQRGPSREVLNNLPLEPVFDFAYIDGSHLASSTLEDSILAWWRLRPGGVLIWDDYRWASDQRKRKRHLARPKIAIDAFLKIYEERYELLPGRGYQVAIQRL